MQKFKNNIKITSNSQMFFAIIIHPNVQRYCTRRREMDLLLDCKDYIIANNLCNVSLKKRQIELYGE